MDHMERVTFVQGLFCGLVLAVLIAMALQHPAKPAETAGTPAAAQTQPEHH